MKQAILIKRVYDKPLQKDGTRILVDRLWPRGLSTEEAAIDEWQKDLAPSTKLRTWYGHQQELWPSFQKQYVAELKKNKAVDGFIEKYKDTGTITLLYAAKNTEHTHALILQQYLKEQFTAEDNP